MTTNTQINITAKDSTAGAFASANNNLSGLASTALKATAGIAGIGLSIAGAVDAIKGISQATIQFQKFNSTLLVGTGSAQGAADALSFVRSESNRLGLDLATAAEQFGKLTAASKGSALEGKATRDIFSSMSEAAAVLGLSADETRGALNAFQQMISKGKVQAEELRGQLGERLPGAFQLAARAMGVTTAELDKLLVAGKVTAEDLLPKLAVELNKTFGSQAEKSAQGLAGQMNRMNTAIFDLKIAIGESGLINFLSSGIELATKLSNALTSAFGGGQKLNAVEKQVSLIKTLEEELESLQNLTHVPLIGDLLFDKKQADLLKFRIESATEDLGKMKSKLAAEAGTETVISQAAKQTEALSATTKRTVSDAERFITALRKEADTAGLTTLEMKRLEAANLGVSAAANPLISRIEKVTSEMDQQKESARALADDLRKIASITESVKTSEEKLIDTQTELDRLMKSGLGIETYNRALKKAQDETSGVTVATRNTTDEVSQLWIQAGRNIQSTLANSIFNFFDDGLSGMLKNVISTIGRIASEFAALKIAQGIGLAGIFGGAAGGIGGTGAAIGGASLLSNVGSGAGILGTLKNFGGGITSGISGLMSGGGLGALALPLLSGFALNSASNAFAGDKTLGNGFTDFMQKIPILGAGWDILAGFFGREPFKFRQQSIQGTASADGFDGDISNVFRSKGGVFSGNKHRTQTEQFNKEQQAIFDSAIGGFYTSAKGFVDNLGLSADLVDNFSQQVQIKSEKGKTVTEEAIAEMIAGIGDSLAKNVLPNVEEFRSVGETTIQTLSRLSGEFTVLTNAASLLFNKSSELSKSFVNQFSFGDRSAFLEKAGGADAFAANVSGFAQNFLTDDQRFKPVIEALVSERDKLGLSGINTREKLTGAVQSGDLNQDQILFLLKNQEAINQVFNYLSKFDEVINISADSADDLLKITQDKAAAIRSLESQIAENIKTGWRDILSSVSDEINSLKGFADSLKGTVETINPKGIDAARLEILNATAQAGQGKITDVSGALSTISSQTGAGFSTREAFARSKAFSVSLIDGLSTALFQQVAEKQKTVDIFSAKLGLTAGTSTANQAAIDKQSADVTKLMQDLVEKTAANGKHTQDLLNLWRRMSPDGTALRTA